MKNLNFFWYVALMAFFVGCSPDKDAEPTPEIPKELKGAFVLNEGSSHSTISLFQADSVEVINDLYEISNEGVTLGKYAQSMMHCNDHFYIVVTTADNNGYIEVVNDLTFKSVATIEKFDYPREIIAVSDTRAFFTNGNGLTKDGSVAQNEVVEIDLTTNAVVRTIKVGGGPEKMIHIDNKLYVPNSGGWGNNDNTISVIDLDANVVVDTISVKMCPVDMEKDKDGNLWVLCIGAPNDSWVRDDANLVKVNLSTKEQSVFSIGKKYGSGIKNLAVSNDGQYVYLSNNGLYRMSIDASEFPTAKFVTGTKYDDVTFYGLEVEPKSGDIYALNSGSALGTNGSLVVFKKDGSFTAEYEVGISPNSAIFVNK